MATPPRVLGQGEVGTGIAFDFGLEAGWSRRCAADAGLPGRCPLRQDEAFFEEGLNDEPTAQVRRAPSA
ncbi:MAG: hypothetical protein U0527_06885 [Candidatus Eisenbacteria bacterium]